MVKLSAWGRLSHDEHRLIALSDRTQVGALLGASRPGIVHAAGGSYGDAALNPGGTAWGTRGLDRFMAFDAASGRLRCEPGVLLRDIQALAQPRGWALPVTPGTLLVTVGGAIANDVHGKNHHRHGCFGEHVSSLTLVRSEGQSIVCGPDHEPGWFHATVGGAGLTGVITEAELQLQPSHGPWLEAETLAFAGLAEFFALADGSEADWEHTVAWIDCLSGPALRGLFTRARSSPSPNTESTRPVPASQSGLSVPFVPPISLINGLSLRLFNAAYYHLHRRRSGRRVVHQRPCLYPLDGVRDWNRIYGPAGFYQYQSVLPRAVGAAATQAMLDAVAASGQGSFLAVLKTLGERAGTGLLSFAQPGVTLALDFPNRGPSTLQLFERLDAIVREAGGRLYLAKDARMPRAMFEAGYPRAAEFQRWRDPGISSAMSRRLMGS